MSAVIRRQQVLGGLILSASHNPGGPHEDFGIKYNMRNGGPSPERVTEAIYAHTRRLSSYATVDTPAIDLDTLGETSIGTTLGTTHVCVFDPLADYTTLMQNIFDFEALRSLFHSGFRMLFDAMHAITGPYAQHIFEDCLGAPTGTVIRGTPLEDFGGLHPDPNLVHAAELVARLSPERAEHTDDVPDFGAACDGDGDRNLILGRHCFVTPGDSLAIIAEHAADCIPGYHAGLTGVARSMPTSTAVDRVAKALQIPCYETPTGWKFFGNLMDAGLCTVCGEESFGTGSNHIREKDGLWEVLCWLSILATTGKSVSHIVHEHWQRFGRSYYQRHDFEGLEAEAATAAIVALRDTFPTLVGTPLAGSAVSEADDFSYTDPVDASVSTQQGLRVRLADGSRIVCRLSGTGTDTATLRLYAERYDPQGGNAEINTMLAALIQDTLRLLKLRERCGVERASVIT
jgi:phosphoglucomutase